MQAAQKHDVGTLAEKMRLNLFEATMKMDMEEQTTPPGYALEIINEETVKAMEYRHLNKHTNKEIRERWTRSLVNYLGNLAQGVDGHVKGTSIIYFIKHKDMPADQKATYGQIVVDYCPQKEYPYCTRLTMGVVLINLPGKVGTPMADMLTYKLLFKSVLLTPYVKFMGIDIKKLLPQHADGPI